MRGRPRSGTITAMLDRPRRAGPVALFGGLAPVEASRIPAELIAGVTLAALAIPEVMGYTKIAGTPVVTGLYTIVLPLVVFAFLGSSRHLVVGADSATAAILAAGLGGLAAKGSAEYTALAATVALLAGAFLLVARIVRLGFLADFLSRTVLVGFLTGVGLQVACGQLAGMLGVTGASGGPIKQIEGVIDDLGNVSWATVGVSAAMVLVIVGGRRLLPKVPWALVAVIGAIVGSYALDLPAHGVATIGSVPSGLPSLGIPDVPLDDIPKLLGTAVSIFVVILAQSAATSRAYATKFGDAFDEDSDLVGLSLANALAGLSGTIVVNGSPTKTAMVDSAGGRSQLAQLSAAACVVLVLLFLTGPLSHMPAAVLSTVVFLIAVQLVDVKGMREILRRRPFEFGVALITAVTVVFVGVREGIVLAIVLSVVIHLRHSYRPESRLVAQGPSGSLRTTPLGEHRQLAPGLAVYLFGASLYYANAERFAEDLHRIVHDADPPLRWLCIEAEAMGDVDFTGSATLAEVHQKLRLRGITLVLCGLQDNVRAELERDGLIDAIGRDHVFEWLDDVVAAY
jgi:high affinity sulfate transporter 1